MGKETINKTTPQITKISVQRLTEGHLKIMGYEKDIIFKGKVCIVALERNGNGNVLQAKIMEGVNEKEFLHGKDEDFDKVLKKAKKLLTSKNKA